MKKIILVACLLTTLSAFSEPQKPQKYEPSGTGVMIAEFVYNHPVLLCALVGFLGNTTKYPFPTAIYGFLGGGLGGYILQSPISNIAHRWLHLHGVEHQQKSVGLFGTHCQEVE